MHNVILNIRENSPFLEGINIWIILPVLCAINPGFQRTVLDHILYFLWILFIQIPFLSTKWLPKIHHLHCLYLNLLHNLLSLSSSSSNFYSFFTTYSFYNFVCPQICSHRLDHFWSSLHYSLFHTSSDSGIGNWINLSSSSHSFN